MSSSKTPPNKAWKKRLTTIAKVAIFVAVLWWVRGTLLEGLRQLGEHQWTLHWPWLLAAGGIYLLGLLPAGLYWYTLLRRLGQDVRLGETLRAYYIGHLGKYVPGKAMVVLLRAGLIRGQKIHRPLAAASVFFETLTMMAVGALLASVILAVWFRDQTLLMTVGIALGIGAGLPTIPPVFRLLARLAGIGKNDPELRERMKSISFTTLLFGWCCMGVCWTLLGLSLWATLGAFGADTSHLVENLPRYIASVSLAMVAGFLSLIPGGLGVRDMVLMQLLVPYFEQMGGTLAPKAAATISTVLLRVIWLVAELAISAVLYVALRAHRIEEAEPIELDHQPIPEPHTLHQPNQSPAKNLSEPTRH